MYPRFTRLSLIGFTSLAMGLGATAQSSYPSNLRQIENLRQHSPNVPTKTVLLDIDGDFRKDAVVLSSGTAYLSWAVGSFMSPDTVAELGLGLIRDIAVLPGLNPGDPDRLISVGVDGALSWSYDEVSEKLVSTNLNIPNWTFASRIVSADVDAGGVENDLVAVALDNVTVGIVSNVGVVSSDPAVAQSIWPTILSTDSQGTTVPILDFAVGDVLDGSSDREELIAVRGNDVWVVEHLDGASYMPINTITEGAVVVIENNFGSTDREEVAISGKDSATGDHWIRTAYEGGNGMEAESNQPQQYDGHCRRLMCRRH